MSQDADGSITTKGPAATTAVTVKPGLLHRRKLRKAVLDGMLLDNELKRREVNNDKQQDSGRKNPAKRKIKGLAFVWSATITAVIVIGIVVVLTQVGFYSDEMVNKYVVAFGLLVVNLAYVIPWATEGFVWAFTILSATAVINGKPAARYTRLMWLFAAVQAAVNASHNISRNDPLTGLVLGALSLAPPLLVHYTLAWSRDSQRDLTLDQFHEQFVKRLWTIARRTAQVLVHPRYTCRAISIATAFSTSWDHAFRTALLGKTPEVKALLERHFAEALASGELAVRIPGRKELSAGGAEESVRDLLQRLTEKEALSYALSAHPECEPPYERSAHLSKALAWLQEHGRRIDRSNSYKLFAKIAEEAEEAGNTADEPHAERQPAGVRTSNPTLERLAV